MSSPTPPFDPPPQANDPAVLPGGRVVPRYAPPPVGGDTFRVDLERAPQAIRELEDALAQLREIRHDAVRMARVTPPTADSVSRDAAAVLGAAANGNTGSLVAALDSGIDQIETLIAKLTDDLRRYRASDRSAADELGDAL